MDESTASWHERHPDRWGRELAELDATGWDYRVTRSRWGIGLLVHVPLPAEPLPIRVRVLFHETYPWFPPTVLDADKRLTASRHRNPASGELCLVHAEDWHADTTVAGLLSVQLPRLLQADATQDNTGVAGLEYPVPSTVYHAQTLQRATVIVTDIDVPPGVEQGALTARFNVDGSLLGSGVLEAVLGEGVDARCDLPPHVLAQFAGPIAGRWIRDPGYRHDETPAAIWKRITPRLRPLALVNEGTRGSWVDNSQAELIGLLVPDAVDSCSSGESWAFLLRIRSGRGRAARWKSIALRTQYYSRRVLAERTPVASALTDASVFVVGLGALGLPLVQDLAQSGVGKLTVLDRDHVDVGTGTRQYGVLDAAGFAKAEVARNIVVGIAPYCDITAFCGSLEAVWDRAKDEHVRRSHQEIRRELVEADLVIDATGNLAATRVLDRLRRAYARPFLHVSATAGGWGGVIALLERETGCWACVELARNARQLPIPAADPDGWVNPTRCAAPTFTGARHQMQQISLHAAAVAIAHLTGEPMQLPYHAASLRDRDGKPAPVRWREAVVPVADACPMHRRNALTQVS